MASAASYDVLLFDLGGVIVELVGLPAFRGWMAQRMSDDEIWERWIRSPTVRSFESGNSEAEEGAAGVIAEFELPVDAQTFMAETLESVGARSRFVGSAAQQVGAGVPELLRQRDQLILVLDGAGAGDQSQFAATDHGPTHPDPGVPGPRGPLDS